MSVPHLIFGCANIGDQVSDLDDVSHMLDTLKASAVMEVDTAARYPPTSPGSSQRLLGEAKVADLGFKIDTKIDVSNDPNGSLTAASIDASIMESLGSLGIPKYINVLYCHAPDNQTSLEEQAAAFDRHYRQGRFDYLGVSNFKPEMVENWMRIADENGYVKPTYYQGQYNLYYRHHEKEIFPVLRKHNMHFTAFRQVFPSNFSKWRFLRQREASLTRCRTSPLAGGFLTGKLRRETTTEARKGTRFEAGTPGAKAFGFWYDKSSMYSANDKLRALGEEHNLPMAEIALRWILHHSMLREGDGVIIGASRVAQLEASIASVRQGPLPGSLPDELCKLWHVVEANV